MIKQRLYRIPQQGKLKGVCAGLAHYFNIPVRLVRVIVVLSMLFGLFLFTLLAYFALAMLLDEIPPGEQEQQRPLSTGQLLDQLGSELSGAERQLRQVERYVTSETFNVRNRFSQL